jgi:hypothetical protein
MRRWNLIRYTLTSCAAGALLAACGGSQPDGRAGVTPQTSAIASARSAANRLSASYQLLYRFRPPLNGEHPTGDCLT